jgi:hypothetical protein
VEILADWFVEVNDRAAGVFGVIREAATVDPEVATIELERARQRLAGYSEAAREFARRGALRPDSTRRRRGRSSGRWATPRSTARHHRDSCDERQKDDH